MKKIYTYKYVLASVALLMASCQANEVTDEWSSSPEDIVTVNATISGLQARADSEAEGNAWVKNDKIRVTNISANAISGKNKADFIYNGAEFTLTDKYAVWIDGENTFEAYYPSGGMATYDKFVLSGYQNTLDGLRENDWMTATATTAKTPDNRLKLEFKHQLAKVVVKITKYNDQYSTASLPVVSDPTFTNLPHDERIAHPYVGEEKGDDKEVVKAYMITDKAEGKHTFMAILPTGKYAEGAGFLRLDINGESHVVTANSTLTAGLEAGKAYTFNLTVGKNKATISSVSVADWTGSSLGEAIADETMAYADASTHTVYIREEGQLTPEMLQTALGNGHDLKIVGRMSYNGADYRSTDVGVLQNYLDLKYNKADGTPVNLDLSEVQMTELPGYALSYDSHQMPIYYLGNVRLPKCIEKIEGAFLFQVNCRITNWDELTALKSIGYSAFRATANAGDITLPASLKTLGMIAFADNDKITSIVIPDGVTEITASTFCGCTSLKHIVYKGDMKSGTVNLTFEDCPALESIDLSACTTVPQWESNFQENYKNVSVYVKDEAMQAAFKGDEKWGQFKEIVVKTK